MPFWVAVKGGFELGDSTAATLSSPFIDFHYSSGRQEDFNVRLINDADGWLVVRGGNLAVEGLLRAVTLELTSDRNAKMNVLPIDPQKIIQKIAALPISTWSYTNSPTVRHLGPMAQDFHEAFACGEDSTHISVVDGIGIALTGIKAVHSKVVQNDEQLDELHRELAETKEKLAVLEQSITKRLANLEALKTQDSLEARAK